MNLQGQLSDGLLLTVQEVAAALGKDARLPAMRSCSSCELAVTDSRMASAWLSTRRSMKTPSRRQADGAAQIARHVEKARRVGRVLALTAPTEIWFSGMKDSIWPTPRSSCDRTKSPPDRLGGQMHVEKAAGGKAQQSQARPSAGCCARRSNLRQQRHHHESRERRTAPAPSRIARAL